MVLVVWYGDKLGKGIVCWIDCDVQPSVLVASLSFTSNRALTSNSTVLTTLTVIATCNSSSHITAANNNSIAVAASLIPSLNSSNLSSPSQSSSSSFYIKNAFLHGQLHEEVYMSQTPGFTDPNMPTMCVSFTKLFMALNKHLGHDNLIVTRRSNEFIASLVLQLSDAFVVKDFGKLYYFLGVKVLYQPIGLTLTQSQYVRELLAHANMDGAKPIGTPMAAGLQLSQHRSSPFLDPSLYHILIGAIQYINITRPDESFTVNKLCQFMHKPMESHFTAMKYLLRYLKATINIGLNLHSANSLPLQAFTDVDWASFPGDRRSTNGYFLFIGPNLVSWISKK
ncbi:uncharacterized mitochondrial protein AtMg00810-like [Capsicum annuum]|uniref:uncharacterized mitochondrial protein AtMg00810-like n=1 Tax=Capsicum annuum TaxID=4072 RepID=UPI001FB079AC|nr:uncharacterized mitochondrial protein AtMg00810-like [Capsicum annuum]